MCIAKQYGWPSQPTTVHRQLCPISTFDFKEEMILTLFSKLLGLSNTGLPIFCSFFILLTLFLSGKSLAEV